MPVLGGPHVHALGHSEGHDRMGPAQLAEQISLLRTRLRAARKRVEEEFSIDQCVKAHLDLYQEMLYRIESRRIAAE